MRSMYDFELSAVGGSTEINKFAAALLTNPDFTIVSLDAESSVSAVNSWEVEMEDLASINVHFISQGMPGDFIESNSIDLSLCLVAGWENSLNPEEAGYIEMAHGEWVTDIDFEDEYASEKKDEMLATRGSEVLSNLMEVK